MMQNRTITSPWSKAIAVAALAAVVAAMSGGAWAQDAAAAATEVAAAAPVDATAKALEDLMAKATLAELKADNAWILTSSALVLMMTAPGLILFYGGLVRAKNVLSVMMQGFFLMAMVSIVWLAFGYSLAFGDSGSPFIGNLDHLFFNGVSADEPGIYVGTIPAQSFALFQLMFAIITPALIVGAFAERFRFKALVAFMLLWLLVVYLPLAHMVWGAKGLFNWYLVSEGLSFPALDFAGGTVVHISSGVSALVCALYLGKRVGYPSGEFAPHSVVLSAIGAGLLWVGWFGFNAGSALGAAGLATTAFASTHFSAAGATFSWMAAEWITRGKPSVLGAISGAVAGLVVVTPAAGFVSPTSGLIMGLIGGVVCFAACSYLKPALKYDDSLDVFGVHGVGGITGAILTGVFATTTAAGAPVGLLEGNVGQFINQIIAVGITVTLAVVATGVILFLVDKTIGIRPTVEEETEGLDIVDHGEQGYHRLTA